MKYTTLPGTQERISSIGLGTWVFGGENWSGADDKACLLAVDQALASGINFIDTAPFYSQGKAEELVGQAIKGKREKFFIATKCGLVRENGRVRNDLTRDSIRSEVDASRKRLQCDIIDLYMCHWPDPNTPVETTMEALNELKKEGKIRHIGVSNFDLALLQKSIAIAPVKTLQVGYSLLDRAIEKDPLPFCYRQGIGVIAYGALGGGILTGKYQEPPRLGKWDARNIFYKYYSGEKFQRVKDGVEKLKNFGHPVGQVALNWVRQQPGVMTVLVGCRNSGQVFENAKAAEWDLTSDETAQIRDIAL